MAKVNEEYKVAMEGGHGRYTFGKRSPADEREWSFNNIVVSEAIRLLRMNGIKVLRLDDPTGKRDVPLHERTDKANEWGADILVSCHHNAMTGVWGNWTGTETFIYNRGDRSKDRKLANEIHERLLKAYELYNRGVKSANFHMLREANMPSVLTEGGFMDSRIDIQKMRDDAVLKDAGLRHAQGIAAYLGIKLKTTLAGPEKEPEETLYRVQVGSFTEFGKVAAFADKVEKSTGFKTYIPEVDGQLKVQVGAFFDKSKAEKRLALVKDAGYSDAWISTADTQAVPELEPQNEPVPAPKPKPKPVTNPDISGAKWIKDEVGYFLPSLNIKVRNAPTTKATHTGTLPKGSSIKYHKVYEGNGHRWLQYTGNSGNTLYVPYRRLSGDTKNWGTFHGSRPVAKKSNEAVAREILYKRNYGGWGVGTTRKQRLKEAGYDPDVIQRIINKLH